VTTVRGRSRTIHKKWTTRDVTTSASLRQTKRSTCMARSETNVKTSICKISKWQGHPSNPSHPPRGRGECVCVTTVGLSQSRTQSVTVCLAHFEGARHWHASGWAGEQKQGVDDNPLNTLTASRAMASRAWHDPPPHPPSINHRTGIWLSQYPAHGQRISLSAHLGSMLSMTLAAGAA